MKKLSLLLALVLCLTGCSQISATSLTLPASNDIAPVVLDAPDREANQTVAVTDMSLSMLKQLMMGGNTLISPLSIVSALGMTANGAAGETLTQMEGVLGMDSQTLNDFLYAYTTDYLPSDGDNQVSIANSIWYRDVEELTIEDDFLQANADYYRADLFLTPFDSGTKNDINSWVDDKTEGKIDTLLDNDIPDTTMMYLINALSFDGEWETIYMDNQVKDGTFTTADGTEQDCDFMVSTEYHYLEMDGAIGFAKDYADGEYSFVALLPDEDLGEFMVDLEATDLMETLENEISIKTYTYLPKFEFDYSTELNDVLQAMGMTDGFDTMAADFSAMGRMASPDENLYISSVIHKTTITVDERGTSAGAVTAVSMDASSSSGPSEVMYVTLDRPFFFMIVDNQMNLPLFMGVVESVL